MNKIDHIQKCFKSAHDWRFTVTGAGLQETDRGNFEDAILKRCPWYFDLTDIMADRASAKPVLTTLELDSNSTVDPSEKNDSASDSDDDDESSDEDEEGDENKNHTEDIDASSSSRVTPTKARALATLPLSIRAKKDKRRNGGGTPASGKKSREEKENYYETSAQYSSERTYWAQKKAEFDYKIQLWKEYLNLKKEGIEKKTIKKMFPDMAKFVHSDDDSSTGTTES